jgi:penicillin amidase
MHLSRVLRAVNVLILVAAVALLAALWWFLYRPGPTTSGDLAAPVSARVTITRDEYYRPHIKAATIDDALFAQGYVTAQERLWQMDMLRRVASGELSEIAGRAALELDTNARKLRLGRIADMQVNLLPPDQRRALAAFARGVNHFIDTHRGSLSWEFTVMGYQPRPWRIADSLLAILQMDRTLTNSWETDLQKGRLLATGNPDLVRQLFPVHFGPDAVEGSNAFAISGQHTASGKPLLAGDPHLEFGIPSPWFPIHIQAPGLDVAGAAYIGFPGVAIGHNENIAWSVTSLEFDAMDLYTERIDLRSGRYEYKGQVLQATPQRDRIAIKGERGVETLTWVTNHGPIFVAEAGQAYSLKWAAAEPQPYSVPILALNQAGNWEEFRSALSSYAGPGFNWIFASRDGHIGHQAAGRLPFRGGFGGDTPLDGPGGGFEWTGLVPFDQLPSVFDPPSGRVVSANQDPFIKPTPYAVNGNFAAPFRSRQIRDMLGARGKWTAAELLTIQKDVYSGLHHAVALEALRVAKIKGGALAGDVSILNGWNGQMELGQPAPVLAEYFYRQIRRRLGERAAGAPTPKLTFRGSTAAVLNLVRTKPPGWFKNWDEMLASALADAVDEARRQYGKNPSNWDWGQENRILAAHPIASRVSWLAPYFNVGPLGISGSSQSVKQAGGRILPSLRFVADTSDWDRSLLVLPTGQSGHLVSGFSRHYKDEWDDFSAGRARPFLFGKVPADATLTLQPSKGIE